jgi:PKHD-type hydroxylase
MPFGVMKYAAPLDCFAVWRDAFTPEEIERITFLEAHMDFQSGAVGSGGGKPARKEVRDSDIGWLHPDNNTNWIFERFSGVISRANYDHFMYDIEGLEALQYTKYGLNQHYTWHWDLAFGWENYQRKISVVMLLDDPEDYEGGEFEICNNGNLDDIKSLKPKKGDIILFASWMPHRVKPVLSGRRRSIVSWVMGKRQS